MQDSQACLIINSSFVDGLQIAAGAGGRGAVFGGQAELSRDCHRALSEHYGSARRGCARNAVVTAAGGAVLARGGRGVPARSRGRGEEGDPSGARGAAGERAREGGMGAKRGQGRTERTRRAEGTGRAEGLRPRLSHTGLPPEGVVRVNPAVPELPRARRGRCRGSLPGEGAWVPRGSLGHGGFLSRVTHLRFVLVVSRFENGLAGATCWQARLVLQCSVCVLADLLLLRCSYASSSCCKSEQ